MLKNIKNKLGQSETYRSLSSRYDVYGCVKKIDLTKGIVYFESIFFEDEKVQDSYFISPENYINYNNTIKNMHIKEGDWISFRGTTMNYSVPCEDGFGHYGLSRLVNIRNIKKINHKC